MNNQKLIEQAVVDCCYSRIDNLIFDLKTKINHLLKEDFSFNDQAKGEQDSYISYYQTMLEHYDIALYRLLFGKLIYNNSQEKYVGRIGLRDENGEILLVDWRSSVGSDFYGATYKEPKDIFLRRHIQVKDREVKAIEDELLTTDKNAKFGNNVEVMGEGAIFQTMNENRTDHMVDIVATIQEEQNKIIRLPFSGVRIVQGGAGTGKTAVALHRVAYLLYNNREILKNNKVLFVGPSNQFLNYIDQVLPSLGETGTVSRTITQVSDFGNTEREAFDEEKIIKGSLKMSTLIERAVNSYINIPNENIVLSFYDLDIKLTPKQFKDSIKTAKNNASDLNEKYEKSRKRFIKIMCDKILSMIKKKYKDKFNDDQYLDIAKELKLDEEVRFLLNKVWFPLEPAGFIKRLLKNKKRLLSICDGILNAEEINYLLEIPNTISEADIPLIEEAKFFIGDDDEEKKKIRTKQKQQHKQEVEFAKDVLGNVTPHSKEYVTPEMLISAMSTVEQDYEDDSDLYHYIVVDEAQELSPMQFLMLKRKSLNDSFTIVGDIAQRTNPSGIKNWHELNDIFDNVSLDKLSINYRNPQKIANLSYEVALANGLNVDKTSAVRNFEDCLIYDNLNRLEIISNNLPEDEKTEIITPENVINSKGLEYDNVIIVEPKNFKPQDLYIALTRATKRTFILHDGKLPDGFKKEGNQ